LNGFNCYGLFRIDFDLELIVFLEEAIALLYREYKSAIVGESESIVAKEKV
jgi:hypothetical protein